MNFTTIEQSKKLIEAGLSPKTADMWWTPLNWQLTEYYVEVKQDGIGTPKNSLPCWSTGALISLLPNLIVKNNMVFLLSIEKGLNKNGYTYYVQYIDKNGIVKCNSQLPTNSFIDSLVECVLWLLKNGYIEKKGK